MAEIRVLVVEDDQLTRTQLSRVVGKEGFAVQSAENGKVGLELFERSSPQIVITDLRMPGVDGLELVHTIKHAAPDTEIIVTTAYGETETAIMLLREGVLDYLKKPIDLDELLLALGRAREKVELRGNLPHYPRLLLADDDDGSRQRLARVLEQEHWEVLQAEDGRRAVELFTENRVDVVLLDVKMPHMDGIEALHAMRQLRDDFAALLLTGYGDESLAIKAMREGALNFLKKPIDLEQLIVAADKALQRVQIERALRYRTRELKLAEQIIARITALKEIVIDIGGTHADQVRAFGRELLETLPIALFVVDEALRVRFVNQEMIRLSGGHPERLEVDWLRGLDRAGLREVDWGNLAGRVQELVGGGGGQVVKIGNGVGASLILVPLILVEGEHREHAVAIGLRPDPGR